MHLKSSSSSLFLSSVIVLLFAVLTACSPLDIAKTVLGGGPNINGQIGAENIQGVKVETAAPSVSVRPKARVDNIDQSQTTNTEVDPLLLALLIIGWLAPSPGEIFRGIANLFRRRK